MEKQYQKIAHKIEIPPQGVHLVHYVLQNMRTSCVFPPSVKGASGSFFSPMNICSALFAYLNKYHSEDPVGTLGKFGIASSTQVGLIVKFLQKNQKTKTVSNLEIVAGDFDGIFPKETPLELRAVRWVDQSEENSIPDRLALAHILLQRHFNGPSFNELVVSKRKFPEHVRADLQLALDHVFEGCKDFQLHGLTLTHSHEGVNFRLLTDTNRNYAARIGPLTYSEINVGSGKTVKCLANGLWLAVENRHTPFAVVLGNGPSFQNRGVQIEYVTQGLENSQKLADAFFEDLQKRVEESKCYRGKILSFERCEDYHGHAAGVKVHELKQVEREEVILPQKTLELLDRNIIDFVQQRPELKMRGMNLKKGLLFFGPPGTGKTHTVHYLTRALPDTTTLVISSEQIGWLSRYMTLARLLQPSLVVIEDADLIARQRDQMGTCEEVLLNKLLNEMDGLRADADIVFVLTTNRPEALEAALTARPGRIDQAIEFPLPDKPGRRQLAQLYVGNQEIDEDAIQLVVAKTEQTSAAFIKELMRRATQYAIVRGTNEQIGSADIETAVQEMLFSGGAFNRKILGAMSDGN